MSSASHDSSAITNNEAGIARRLALSAGLGSGFSLLIYMALDHFLHLPIQSQLSEIVAVIIVSIGVVAFLEPLFEAIRSGFGLSSNHHSDAQRPSSRQLKIVAILVIAGASLSHALLHVQVNTNPIGTIFMLMPATLFPAITTYVWIRQLRKSPWSAPWAGAVVAGGLGGIFLLLIWIMMGGRLGFAGGPVMSLSFREVAPIALINACQWGIFGLAGGLALWRGWAASPARGVALAFLTATALFWILLIAIGGPSSGVFGWITMDVFRALGWAAGILVFGSAANRVLRPNPSEQKPSIIPQPTAESEVRA